MSSKSPKVTAGAIRHRMAVSVLVAAVSLLAPHAGGAQTPVSAERQGDGMGTTASSSQGVINGTVITPDGAPLPNTAVRARNLLTGEISGETTTGPDGQYSFNVEPGNYVIEILGEEGLVLAATAFVSAVAGVTLATAATVAATASALTAVSGATGLVAVLGTAAARTATFAAAAAGVAGVVVPESVLIASPSGSGR